jgi:hypothetical protein
MQAQQAYVARSRRAEGRDLTQRTLVQAPPHKERALWNFLTWSFFLAQVLAAEQFIGAQARASETLDLSSSDQATAMAAPPLDALAALDGAGNLEEDPRLSPATTLDDVFAQSLKLGQFDGSVVDLDAIAAGRTEDVSQSISVATAASEAFSPGDATGGLIPGSVVDVVIPDLLDVIGDTTGPLLDSVEDIVVALTGLVGSITDPLLGTVGGVVHAVDDVVQDVLALPGRLLDGSASPVTALLDITDDLAGTTHDVLVSAGQLTFPLLNLVSELDELFTSGRYTEYNIELQSSLPGASAAASTDPVTSAAAAVVDVVDHVVDTATRPLAHLLDDLGSRDGLL